MLVMSHFKICTFRPMEVPELVSCENCKKLEFPENVLDDLAFEMLRIRNFSSFNFFSK